MNERHTDEENELLAFIEPDRTWREATEQEKQAARIRRRVMSYMSYEGERRNRINPLEWELIWLLGDGFGHVDREFANEQCWDWSHVRDSSENALAMIWQAIKRFDPKHPGA